VLLIFSKVYLLKAQVTIGMGEAPVSGALLQLKTIEDLISEGNANASKGMALPRVILTVRDQLYPMFLTDPTNPSSGEAEEYNSPEKKASLNASHRGLMVYNMGGDEALSEGLYFWDGEEWSLLVSSSSDPIIDSLVCNRIKAERENLTQGVEFSTYVYIPYTGGNGAFYPQGPVIDASTGEGLVQGLQAQLQEGTLPYGHGELVYRVWGIPTSSSPNVARFEISFPAEGNENINCSFELGKNNNGLATTESVTVLGPLIYTEENNVPGWGQLATTPMADGLSGHLFHKVE
ncbi:MAG: hypothetical protein LIO93_02530, partial [Bacteroidales bacterium]|nr:hypothetical protein [Bacteroidales bacterium]